MNKGLKTALIAIPLLLGGYLIYNSLTKKKREEKKREEEEKKRKEEEAKTTPVETTKKGGATFKVRSEFPLKKGSKGAKVRELQEAIIASGNAKAISYLGKAGADGSFGSGTEKAVKEIIGKVVVASQADLDKIKNYQATQQQIKQKAETSADRKNLANKLIAEFKALPKFLDFYAVNDVQVTTGKVTSDGREINKVKGVVSAGTKLKIPSDANFFVDTEGFVKIKGNGKVWQFSPYGFEVK